MSNILYYILANLKVKINGMDNYEFFRSRLSEYEVGVFEDADVTINHSEPDYIEKPIGEIVVEKDWCRWITTPNGGFGIYDTYPNSDNQLSSVIADKTWTNITTKLRNIVDIGGSSNDTRCFNMVGDIMRNIMLAQNGMMLHSSAISYNGQGIAFSAPPGTGKSTHTKLWQELYGENVRIINDDMPVVRFTNDVPLIAGLPWSGTSGINENKIVPLKAIICLERGDENSISSLDSQKAVFRILNETTKPFYPQMMQILLERVEKVIKTTPVYLLKCTISKQAVEIVKKEIFEK